MLALVLALSLTGSPDRIFPPQSLQQMRVEFEQTPAPASISVRGPLVTAVASLALMLSGVAFGATAGSNTTAVLGGAMSFAGAGVHLLAFVWWMGLFGGAPSGSEFTF